MEPKNFRIYFNLFFEELENFKPDRNLLISDPILSHSHLHWNLPEKEGSIRFNKERERQRKKLDDKKLIFNAFVRSLDQSEKILETASQIEIIGRIFVTCKHVFMPLTEYTTMV